MYEDTRKMAKSNNGRALLLQTSGVLTPERLCTVHPVSQLKHKFYIKQPLRQRILSSQTDFISSGRPSQRANCVQKRQTGNKRMKRLWTKLPKISKACSGRTGRIWRNPQNQSWLHQRTTVCWASSFTSCIVASEGTWQWSQLPPGLNLPIGWSPWSSCCGTASFCSAHSTLLAYVCLHFWKSQNIFHLEHDFMWTWTLISCFSDCHLRMV